MARRDEVPPSGGTLAAVALLASLVLRPTDILSGLGQVAVRD